MFKDLYNKLKRITEGVSELISEIPGMGPEDQEALRKAIEQGIISDVIPPYGDMMDEIKKLPGVEPISFSDIGPDDKLSDKADVAGIYIQKVLLPIAKGEKPSASLPVRGKDIPDDVLSVMEDVLFEVMSSAYVDLMNDEAGGFLSISDWGKRATNEILSDMKSHKFSDYITELDIGGENEPEQEEALKYLYQLKDRELERFVHMTAMSAYKELQELL